MEKTNLRFIDYGIAFGVLLILVFAIPRILPGDSSTILFGEEAILDMSPEQKDLLLAESGLNDSYLRQFNLFLKGIVNLDFGYSFHYNSPVFDLVLEFAPWTFGLMVQVLLLSMLAGFMLGIESAYHAGKRWHAILDVVMVVFNSLPPFVIAMCFLLTFAFQWEWFPISGAVTPFTDEKGWRLFLDMQYHAFLPALSLSAHLLTNVYLLTRGSAMLNRDKPYLLVGKAKGLKPFILKYRYLGFNSAAPVVAKLGGYTANLFTGVLLVEIVFSYPGLGYLIFESVMNHDYPVSQAALLVLAVVVFFINFLSDLVVNRLTRRG